MTILALLCHYESRIAGRSNLFRLINGIASLLAVARNDKNGHFVIHSNSLFLVKILEDLGLSEKEAKVYLASLELGESAPAEIAKHAGINRDTTYVIAEKLVKDGLMSQLEKDKKTYFMAENPEQLLRLLRKQEQDIK